MIIRDPDGCALKVSSEGLFGTLSTTQSCKSCASSNGYAYNLMFDTTLTSAAESALLYIRNTNADYPLLLDTLHFSLGPSTGGSGSGTSHVVFNPIGGTIISDATALTAVNRNAGNLTPPSAAIYSGGTGKTATGGTTFSKYLHTASTTFQVSDAAAVLPNGTSAALLYQPPSSNTSQRVVITVIVFYTKLYSDFKS